MALLLDCIHHAAKYYYRFQANEIDHKSVVYKCYLETKQEPNASKTDNWHLRITSLLEYFNIPLNLQPTSITSEKQILKSLKKKMFAKYEEDWKKVITSNDGKLRTYKCFKEDFCLENYILSEKFDKRKHFTKLRISAHKLAVENGRHKRPIIPLEERKCNFCKSSPVEDEFHFILNCKTYEALRSQMFSTLEFISLNNLNPEEQFITLMNYNGGDTEVCKEIINYVQSAFKLRETMQTDRTNQIQHR